MTSIKQSQKEMNVPYPTLILSGSTVLFTFDDVLVVAFSDPIGNAAQEKFRGCKVCGG